MLEDNERLEREKVRPRIYVYRYMWKMKDSDKIQLKVVSDVIKSHMQFRKALQEDENVVSAFCEYVSEYDPYFFAAGEVIKNEENNQKEEKIV